jgi:hypothetical protein
MQDAVGNFDHLIQKMLRKHSLNSDRLPRVLALPLTRPLASQKNTCYHKGYLDFQNNLYLPTFFHLTSFLVLASSSNALCTVFWFRPNFSAISLGVWGSEVRESWTFCRVFSDNYADIFGYFADLYNTYSQY